LRLQRATGRTKEEAAPSVETTGSPFKATVSVADDDLSISVSLDELRDWLFHPSTKTLVLALFTVLGLATRLHEVAEPKSVA